MGSIDPAILQELMEATGQLDPEFTSPLIHTQHYEVGDIVLVRVKGNVFLHLIKAIDNKKRFLIGNNRGKVNGWVGRDAIYGKAIKVEP